MRIFFMNFAFRSPQAERTHDRNIIHRIKYFITETNYNNVITSSFSDRQEKGAESISNDTEMREPKSYTPRIHPRTTTYIRKRKKIWGFALCGLGPSLEREGLDHWDGRMERTRLGTLSQHFSTTRSRTGWPGRGKRRISSFLSRPDWGLDNCVRGK